MSDMSGPEISENDADFHTHDQPNVDADPRFICTPLMVDRNSPFGAHEAAAILRNPDQATISSVPPVRPMGGHVYLYQCKTSDQRKNIRSDQYLWVNEGTIQMPKADPIVKKQYFFIKTSNSTKTLVDGKKRKIEPHDRGFSRFEYQLLEDDVGKHVLVQYLGDHNLSKDLGHGSCKQSNPKPFVRSMADVKSNILAAGPKLPPIQVYRTLLSDEIPGKYEAVMKPRNVQQVKNHQQIERLHHRLGPDGLMNSVEMYYQLDGFIWSVTPVPNVVIPVGNPNLLAEAAKLAVLDTTGLNRFSVYYDTTFNLGDFYVSPLIFRHCLFQGDPLVPMAFLIHERKFTRDHRMFWDLVASKCEQLGKHVFPIVTDREFKDIDQVFPKACHLYCWNHLLKDVTRWVETKGGNIEDRIHYRREVEELLKMETLDQYSAQVSERLEGEVWDAAFKTYFKKHLRRDIELKCGRWVLESQQFYNPFSGVTTNPAESFNAVLQRWQDWKQASIDSFIMCLYYLCQYEEHEIQRGMHGVGTYTLKPQYRQMQRESYLLPTFPASIHPDDIVARVRAPIEDQVTECIASARDNDTDAEVSEQDENTFTRSDNPLYNLALDAFREKRVHHCASACAFIVEEEVNGKKKRTLDGKKILKPVAVKLFPTPQCECKIPACWHILAARISVGDSKVPEPKKRNLTSLVRNQRKAPSGKKNRMLKDPTVSNKQPRNRKESETKNDTGEVTEPVMPEVTLAPSITDVVEFLSLQSAGMISRCIDIIPQSDRNVAGVPPSAQETLHGESSMILGARGGEEYALLIRGTDGVRIITDQRITDADLINWATRLWKFHLSSIHVQFIRHQTDDHIGLTCLLSALAVMGQTDPTRIPQGSNQAKQIIAQCMTQGALLTLPKSSAVNGRPAITSKYHDLFCICRLSDDGRSMVKCSYCTDSEWYHHDCMMLPPGQLKGKWQCSQCPHPPHVNYGGKGYKNTCPVDSVLAILLYFYHDKPELLEKIYGNDAADILRQSITTSLSGDVEIGKSLWIEYLIRNRDKSNLKTARGLVDVEGSNFDRVFQFFGDLYCLQQESTCSSMRCSKVIEFDHRCRLPVVQNGPDLAASIRLIFDGQVRECTHKNEDGATTSHKVVDVSTETEADVTELRCQGHRTFTPLKFVRKDAFLLPISLEMMQPCSRVLELPDDINVSGVRLTLAGVTLHSPGAALRTAIPSRSTGHFTSLINWKGTWLHHNGLKSDTRRASAQIFADRSLKPQFALYMVRDICLSE